MSSLAEIIQNARTRLFAQPSNREPQIFNEVRGADGFIGKLAERVEATRNGTGFVAKFANHEFNRFRRDPARVEGVVNAKTAPSDIAENRNKRRARTRLIDGKLFIPSPRGLFSIEMLNVGTSDDGSRTYNRVLISQAGFDGTKTYAAEDFDPDAEYKIRVAAQSPDVSLLGVETKIGTDSRASNVIRKDQAKRVVEIEKDGGEGWLDEVPHRVHMTPPNGADRRAIVEVPILDRSHDGIKDRIIIKIIEEKDRDSLNTYQSTLVNNRLITQGVIIEFPQPDAETVEYRQH